MDYNTKDHFKQYVLLYYRVPTHSMTLVNDLYLILYEFAGFAPKKYHVVLCISYTCMCIYCTYYACMYNIKLRMCSLWYGIHSTICTVYTCNVRFIVNIAHSILYVHVFAMFGS